MKSQKKLIALMLGLSISTVGCLDSDSSSSGSTDGSTDNPGLDLPDLDDGGSSGVFNWFNATQTPIAERDDLYVPSVAISDSGETFVVWPEDVDIYTKLFAKVRNPQTGEWSSAEIIDDGLNGIRAYDDVRRNVATPPIKKLHVDESGNALLVYESAEDTYSLRYDAETSTWQTPIKVTSGYDVSVSVAPDGFAVVGWADDESGDAFIRTMSGSNPQNGWSDVRRVSQVEGHDVNVERYVEPKALSEGNAVALAFSTENNTSSLIMSDLRNGQWMADEIVLEFDHDQYPISNFGRLQVEATQEKAFAGWMEPARHDNDYCDQGCGFYATVITQGQSSEPQKVISTEPEAPPRFTTTAMLDDGTLAVALTTETVTSMDRYFKVATSTDFGESWSASEKAQGGDEVTLLSDGERFAVTGTSAFDCQSVVAYWVESDGHLGEKNCIDARYANAVTDMNGDGIGVLAGRNQALFGDPRINITLFK